MSEWLAILATLFAVIGGFYSFYIKIVMPKRAKTKLLKLSNIIDEWFDLIDCNLEKDLNMAELNNLENKIHEYIDTNLPKYQIKPKKKLIRKWNKKMGIKQELLDSPDIFKKFSRLPPTGMFMDMFFTIMVANFYKFHTAYNSENKKDCNFADVEMPVKFFKFYVGNL